MKVKNRIKEKRSNMVIEVLNDACQKAMDAEIRRQCAEYDEKNAREITATVLWRIHEEFGFGKNKLKKFYKSFDRAIRDLVNRYHLDDADAAWLCTRQLKEYGIDLEEWELEEKEEEAKMAEAIADCGTVQYIDIRDYNTNLEV